MLFAGYGSTYVRTQKLRYYCTYNILHIMPSVLVCVRWAPFFGTFFVFFRAGGVMMMAHVFFFSLLFLLRMEVGGWVLGFWCGDLSFNKAFRKSFTGN